MKFKIDWGDFFFGLSISIIVALGIVGGVELLNSSTNITIISFYGAVILLIIKELGYGLSMFLKSIKIKTRRRRKKWENYQR